MNQEGAGAAAGAWRLRGWAGGIALSLALLAGLALLTATVAARRGALPQAADAPPLVAAAAPVGLAATPAPRPQAEAADATPARLVVLIETEGEIGRGETLAGSLDRSGVGADVAHEIAEGMSPVFNFRYARPGDRYLLVQDETGALVRFDYLRSAVERYSLRREGDAVVAERHEPELVRRRARIAGVVTSSLYESVADLGEVGDLAHDFAEIFAWDVDFTRVVQAGDEFAMLYERIYLRDEDGDLHYVRPGRILAARYSNAADDIFALYYEAEEGRGGYYRPDGSSVEKQFLKAPLTYRRISSSYTMSRLHPVLKVRRPHQGIDYAAPVGTPVWSVGDGVVIFRGWSGGFGRLVKVRHANGYVSYYGHLSRFADGLRIGDAVRQKQVVGYVGATGLATGPHLDFRLTRNGRYMNPALLQTPAGEPIPALALPRFGAVRDQLLAELDPAPLPARVEEAL